MILPIPIIKEKQIITRGHFIWTLLPISYLVLDEKFQLNKLYRLLGQNHSIERNFLNDAHGLLRTKIKKKKHYKVLLLLKLVLKFLEC